MAKYEEAVISACDSWLSDNYLDMSFADDTLNDMYNDWYNDEVLLPVNRAVDEALTNGGYDELCPEDIRDICDSVLCKDLVVSLVKRSYDAGFKAKCNR